MRGKKCVWEGLELLLTSSTIGTYTGSCGFPNTVEPRLSGPRLSVLFDYLDFFLWSQFFHEY